MTFLFLKQVFTDTTIYPDYSSVYLPRFTCYRSSPTATSKYTPA
ncbi:hypothetical protein [Chitinophaga defluvii]|uniref:Uncharacterized protein n=1 Tax=Chitinophaga defluvii TaxID=3163343 RepID=A0ABV2T2B7_9BACT